MKVFGPYGSTVLYKDPPRRCRDVGRRICHRLPRRFRRRPRRDQRHRLPLRFGEVVTGRGLRRPAAAVSPRSLLRVNCRAVEAAAAVNIFSRQDPKTQRMYFLLGSLGLGVTSSQPVTRPTR